MKVKNKKIIVTGAGSGIGRELVIDLIKKGAFVIGLDISEKGLNETKALVAGKNFDSFVVDMASSEEIEKFYNEYFNKYEGVDGVINNAGIIQPFVKFNELDMNTGSKVMKINFFGPVKLIKMFLPKMFERKEAHIVNVSSMGGFFPFPKQTIYGASKSALKLFSEGLYAELLDTNVGVTVVFPGAVATNIVKNSNVEIKTTSSNYKTTSASDAAKQIIKAIEKNKFQLYIGNDAKMMNLMYKLSPKRAIKLINKKMKDLK